MLSGAEKKEEPGADIPESEEKKEEPNCPQGESEEKKAEVIIESLMGGKISVDEITSRVKKAAGDIEGLKIYVKPEENKAYYVAGSVAGFVKLW